MRPNGRDAPIADLPALTPERGGSTPQPPSATAKIGRPDPEPMLEGRARNGSVPGLDIKTAELVDQKRPITKPGALLPGFGDGCDSKPSAVAAILQE
jgi:hypothetical protein